MLNWRFAIRIITKLSQFIYKGCKELTIFKINAFAYYRAIVSLYNEFP